MKALLSISLVAASLVSCQSAQGPNFEAGMMRISGSGDLLDLLGGMTATPSQGKTATVQNQNNSTFGTGGDGGGAMAGWTTF